MKRKIFDELAMSGDIIGAMMYFSDTNSHTINKDVLLKCLKRKFSKYIYHCKNKDNCILLFIEGSFTDQENEAEFRKVDFSFDENVLQLVAEVKEPVPDIIEEVSSSFYSKPLRKVIYFPEEDLINPEKIYHEFRTNVKDIFISEQTNLASVFALVYAKLTANGKDIEGSFMNVRVFRMEDDVWKLISRYNYEV